MNPEKISKIIKDARIKSGLTQKEFADKYNVTYQAVSKWENAKNLPDVSILREICKDYGLDINDLLDNPIDKKKNIKKIIAVLLFICSIIIVIVLLLINRSSDFKFKTLSASCPNFTVSGNISYNDKKSAIYITNVTYCGGNDETKYDKIECRLFEKDNNITSEISSYTYDKDKIRLEDFLKDLTFVVDNYKSLCKTYTTDSLYLIIDAHQDDKTTEYKIPLSLNENCK